MWEQIDHTVQAQSDRLKVPGGWIVRSRTCSRDGGIHQIFVSDPSHSWKLEV